MSTGQECTVPEVLAAREIHIWCGASVLMGWENILNIANELIEYSQIRPLTKTYHLLRGSDAENESLNAQTHRQRIAQSVDAISKAMFLKFMNIKASVAQNFDYTYDFDILPLSYGRNYCQDSRDKILALQAPCDRPESIDFSLERYELFLDTLGRYLANTKLARSKTAPNSGFSELTAHSLFIKKILSIVPVDTIWPRPSSDSHSVRRRAWKSIKQAPTYAAATQQVLTKMPMGLVQVLGLFEVKSLKLGPRLQEDLRKQFPNVNHQSQLVDGDGYVFCWLDLLFSQHSIAYTQYLAFLLATGPNLTTTLLDKYVYKIFPCPLIPDDGMHMHLTGIQLSLRGSLHTGIAMIHDIDVDMGGRRPYQLRAYYLQTMKSSLTRTRPILYSLSLKQPIHSKSSENTPCDLMFEFPHHLHEFEHADSSINVHAGFKVHVRSFASLEYVESQLGWILQYSDTYDRLLLGPPP